MPRSVNTKNYCLAIFGSLNIKRLPLRNLHTDKSLLALYFGAFINIIHNYLEGHSPLQPQVAHVIVTGYLQRAAKNRRDLGFLSPPRDLILEY
jgi:hypothetical protein